MTNKFFDFNLVSTAGKKEPSKNFKMGQKQSSTDGNTKTKKLKQMAGRAHGITKHHRRRIPDGKDPVALSRSWAEARFDMLTRFDEDAEGRPLQDPELNENSFPENDKIVRKLFEFVAHKASEANRLATAKNTLTKKQWVEAVSSIASKSEQEMAAFIVEAMLFIYNLRENRLHPHSIDASTIRKILNDAGKSDDVSSKELTEIFAQLTGSKSGAISASQMEEIILSEIKEEMKLIKPDQIKRLKHPPHLHPPPLEEGGDEDFDGDDKSDSSDSDSEANSVDKANRKGDEEAKSKATQPKVQPQSTPKTVTKTFQSGPLGMKLGHFLGGKGCVVSTILPGSQADTLGVKKGFVIKEIAGRVCSDATHALNLIKSNPRPITMVFSVQNENTTVSRPPELPKTEKSPQPPTSSKPRGPPTPKALERKMSPTKESKEVVGKKVVIMRQIRDKKLELMNADDPKVKAKLENELKTLVKRLKALDQKEAGPNSIATGKSAPNAATPEPKNPRKEDDIPSKTDSAPTESYEFTADEGRIGLGLSDSPLGIVVSQIAPGSQASLCDEMEVGDILVQVADKDVRKLKRAEVMKIIASASRPLTFKFELGEESESDEG